MNRKERATEIRHRGWPAPSFLLALASAAMPAAEASDACAAAGRADMAAPVVSLRVDNDLFASRDQDYTSGVQLGLVSPNLLDYTTDPCLPRLARWLNQGLDFLGPEGADQKNMVLRIEQRIYTPTDWTRSDLIEDDRPYAGTLMAIAGYNARKGDTLHTTLLGVGILGPSAHAETTQDAIHGITGSDKFSGWDNQLGDELLFGIRHERSYRHGMHEFGAGGLQGDAISHWGGALGNAMTRVNGGFELRLGRNLPNDFGSSPVRPAGDNTAPTPGPRRSSLAWHVFLAVDTYWSIHDPSLDGNLFRSSHSVDKRPVVAESALGFSLTKGAWKLAFARYFRTREFGGQRGRPQFGSMTVSGTF